MIYIVGIGPGHKDYMLNKAINILENSDIIIGFSRAIDSINFIDVKKEKIDSLKGILEKLKNSNENISLVASGDPNFFGIAEYIKKNLDKEISVIPGISSFQYLTSKLNKSWSKAYTGSMHAREGFFLEKIKENNLSIWLCDKKNTPVELCRILNEENIECKVFIGEKLSYEDERIVFGNPKEFLNESFGDLSILIVERV